MFFDSFTRKLESLITCVYKKTKLSRNHATMMRFIWSAEGKNRKKKTHLNGEPRWIPRSRCGRNRWKKSIPLENPEGVLFVRFFFSLSLSLGWERMIEKESGCMHACRNKNVLEKQTSVFGGGANMVYIHL